jgi:hypothetical protein
MILVIYVWRNSAGLWLRTGDCLFIFVFNPYRKVPGGGSEIRIKLDRFQELLSLFTGSCRISATVMSQGLEGSRSCTVKEILWYPPRFR